ncbi:MAG: diaminopimelate epimerase [Lachnospiraceae bacterium]|nr:diaminopimelate epimerase [Lachnospiraceae bacterium]
MKFTKMEGLGNDYIYINCFEEKIKYPEKLAVKMSDRHFGIGSDGLVLIMPDDNADFYMRMFNSDGTEAEMCGNAARCVAKYVYEKGLTDKSEINLNTLSGIKKLKLIVDEKKVSAVTVDMGIPVIGEKIILTDKKLEFCCISMGNPHAVTFVNDVNNCMLEITGPEVEKDAYFENKTNVEFVEIINRNRIKMRVWERGSGETLACGTGACAVMVAAVINGFTDRKAEIELLGGKLIVEWNEDDGRLYMTGPAEFCFDGVWLK